MNAFVGVEERADPIAVFKIVCFDRELSFSGLTLPLPPDNQGGRKC